MENKMKKLTLIIILFCALVSYAQVQGCNWTADLDTTLETDYYQCRGNGEFWFIDVTLIDSADTITVWLGTNKPDSVYTAEDYTQVIAGYKFKNIMLKANAISDTTTVTIWDQ